MTNEKISIIEAINKMKKNSGNMRIKKVAVYCALTLFIFLSTFLSTYHNHEFGKAHNDCPAYILSITFNSADDVSFEAAGKIIFINYTIFHQNSDTNIDFIFSSSICGRSPPLFV